MSIFLLALRISTKDCYVSFAPLNRKGEERGISCGLYKGPQCGTDLLLSKFGWRCFSACRRSSVSSLFAETLVLTSVLGVSKTVGIQIDPKTVDINGALLATMEHVVSEIAVGFACGPAEFDVICSNFDRWLIKSS